jgi:opacity protein-like surface antigen
MRKLLLATALLLPVGAQAADLRLPVKAPLAAVPVCTTSFCTGFYFGAGFDGNGSNADILGSGLSGSVFAAGAVPSVQAGYQLWNGTLFLAGEVGAGYVIPSASTINSVSVDPAQKGWLAYQEAQLGGTLSGLLGTGSTAVTVPNGLLVDLIAPYVALGVAEEQHATGLETGAGAKFVITPNGVLDVGYRYIPFNSTVLGVTQKADNLVRVRFSYIFK